MCTLYWIIYFVGGDMLFWLSSSVLFVRNKEANITTAVRPRTALEIGNYDLIASCGFVTRDFPLYAYKLGTDVLHRMLFPLLDLTVKKQKKKMK